MYTHTGAIVLTQDIETVAKEIIDSKIPHVWLIKSYPSLKSLGAYVKDLQQRTQFLQVIRAHSHSTAQQLINLIK